MADNVTVKGHNGSEDYNYLKVNNDGSLNTVSLEGFNISSYDYIGLSYVESGNGAGEIKTVTYKNGGSNGTTVALLKLFYNSDNEISSIVKS